MIANVVASETLQVLCRVTAYSKQHLLSERAWRADGSLWVHSPVSLDKVLVDALAKIGPVKHIVVRNLTTACSYGIWMG